MSDIKDKIKSIILSRLIPSILLLLFGILGIRETFLVFQFIKAGFIYDGSWIIYFLSWLLLLLAAVFILLKKRVLDILAILALISGFLVHFPSFRRYHVADDTSIFDIWMYGFELSAFRQIYSIVVSIFVVYLLIEVFRNRYKTD
ncbi:MAG: hypothetical protein ABI954_14790 [Pyrinomonadaceae bacterium]